MSSSIPKELTTRPALQQWFETFHNTSKTLDAQAFSQWFTTDATVHFANNPAAEGREAIASSFAFAFDRLDVMIHEIVSIDLVEESGQEPRLYHRAVITYVVKGDDPAKDAIMVPAMMSGLPVVSDEGDDKVGKLKLRRCEIYVDASQVFTRMGEKGLLG